jgi:peptidoglycan/xylan/chitin deacetylase (PgdA/CDA1 family)
MNRRQFTKTLSLGVIALTTRKASVRSASEPPQVAITIDDLAKHANPKLTGEGMTRALISALKAHSDLKAAVFVAGRNVDNDEGKQMLTAWNQAGQLLGNHTYSHRNLNAAESRAEDFAQDILRCEAIIKQYPRFTKLFRFPMLKEGDTREKRDAIRAFLKVHGYRIGHVTIDASDWYVDERMRARLEKNPKADVTPYRSYYLDHIWERTLYYDDLTRKVLGRRVKHTLLIHHNLLNAFFLGDLLRMFERKGWKLIEAEQAFGDPVFSATPNIVPAGESVIWALAKETGKFDKLLRYPGEDSEYEKRKMDRLGL